MSVSSLICFFFVHFLNVVLESSHDTSDAAPAEDVQALLREKEQLLETIECLRQAVTHDEEDGVSLGRCVCVCVCVCECVCEREREFVCNHNVCSVCNMCCDLL